MASPSDLSCFEMNFTVSARDSDCFSYCQAASLLSYLQETGLQAMASLGLNRKYMKECYHSVWMLARTSYTLEYPILLGDDISVRSEFFDGHGLGIYLEHQILRDGLKIGGALALWMIVDEQSRSLKPVSSFAELSGTESRSGRVRHLKKLALPSSLTMVHQRPIEYSQADMNGHLNNSRYADLVCNALELHKTNRAFLSSLQINYLAECLPGCVLTMYAQNEDSRWYIKGVGDDNTSRFEAEAVVRDS